MIAPDWIAVDWGTSNLRVWAMGASGVLAEAASNRGMATLQRDQFEGALLELIEPWLLVGRVTTVIAAGMVGARQGWREAPYAKVPTVPLQRGLMVSPTGDARMRVHICHGLSQAKPADVMRGEETQIAGLLALDPKFEGVVCLPGTHTKWAEISAGDVCSFVSVMTGELFSLLSKQSVLRHSMAAEGFDQTAFIEALNAALTQPQSIATRLFPLRAEGLVGELSPILARSRLSGLLIGIELAATKHWWLGRQIAIVGTHSLAQTYAKGLAHVGTKPKILDGNEVTLAGLKAAYEAVRSDQN